MKKYIKPIIREIILDSEESVLAALSDFDGSSGDISTGEEFSKGNSGWENWEEED